MPEIHVARRALAQLKIAESGADGALITVPENVRYLSGLVSSNMAMLLPADGPALLGTDFRYAETAERDCPDLEIEVERQLQSPPKAAHVCSCCWTGAPTRTPHATCTAGGPA